MAAVVVVAAVVVAVGCLVVFGRRRLTTRSGTMSWVGVVVEERGIMSFQESVRPRSSSGCSSS